MTQRRCGDCLFHAIAVGALTQGPGQRGDAGAGPEDRDADRRTRLGEGDRLRPRRTAPAAGEGQLGFVLGQWPGGADRQHHWFSVMQVGQALGVGRQPHAIAHPGPVSGEVDHRRAFNLEEQSAYLLCDIIEVGDIGEAATANLGGAAHEVTVRRTADAHRIKPGGPDILFDILEQLMLIADGAIGQEDHLTQPVRQVGTFQRMQQGWPYLSATIRPGAGDILFGVGERELVGRSYGVKQLIGDVGEPDDVETVSRA